MVRMRGVEPPRLAALEPKSSASTSSATSAFRALDRGWRGEMGEGIAGARAVQHTSRSGEPIESGGSKSQISYCDTVRFEGKGSGHGPLSFLPPAPAVSPACPGAFPRPGAPAHQPGYARQPVAVRGAGDHAGRGRG